MKFCLWVNKKIPVSLSYILSSGSDSDLSVMTVIFTVNVSRILILHSRGSKRDFGRKK